MNMKQLQVLGLVFWLASLTGSRAPAATVLADWDFTRGTHGWTGNRAVGHLVSTAQGLVVESVAEDPWVEGPAVAAPAEGLLRVTVAMRSDADAAAQIFYGKTFHASRCRTFPVLNDNQFHDYTVIIPESTGPGTRLRLDPCHGPGRVVVRRLRVEALQKPVAPVFDKPAVPADHAGEYEVKTGALSLRHHPSLWNGLRVRLDHDELAVGYDGEVIGVMFEGGAEYVQLKQGRLSLGRTSAVEFKVKAEVQDRQGAHWTVERRFAVASSREAIEVETVIAVDRDREAVLLPWLTVLAGHGSFGTRKHQGLFAGLEYLADEPSSSEADLTGPDHVRRVPDPVKITFPLMAIEHEGRYIGLEWEPSELVAAGFDSPDRVFGSDGHALWLSGPGVGENRFENEWVAHTPIRLQAGVPLVQRATLLAGRSPSVLGAVQHYASRHPWPELPAFPGGFDAAVNLLAHGWLDSAIREDGLFRHADWQDRFKPQPAAGPALFMSWLAQQSRDPQLAGRLSEGVTQTLARVRPGDPFASDVSHVHLPAAPLLFGRVSEFVAQRKNSALAQLRQFDGQGRLIYRPGSTDYGRTHFANHANGLGGRPLADALEAAVLSADEALAGQALAVLDQQAALYAHTVPRGAQTWEIPLHTPDILASAHMVRAYVYGHVLTGRPDYLEQARYWAWSGVPFVYLVNPTAGECGPYATIAVLGATSWVAPVWLGQPVQWCGLVYGSALHLLAACDPVGPWRRLAQGITLAGLQMTWPTTDPRRQGLLPDFFHLRQQTSDGPAINPGTVGAHLPEAFDQGKLYDFHRFKNGWVLHAPCAISGLDEMEDSVRFELAGWGQEPYRICLAGVSEPCQAWAADQPLEMVGDAGQRLLVASLKGRAVVRVTTGHSSSQPAR